MELIKDFDEMLKKIKKDKPLVHHITNYVTTNDCANSVLAMGGSPVMADELEEVEEMVSLASSLVLNIGTLNKTVIKSFIVAGKKANSLGIPVVLDPVGVGATKLRTDTVRHILEEVKISVLRGNMSEIKNIYGIKGLTKGVDSTEDSREGGIEIALGLAKRISCIVVITGVVDIISDGEKIYRIENGHEMLSKVTGTGCMTSSLIGLCCGTHTNNLLAAVMGTAAMGISGELAYESTQKTDQIGTFRIKLMDAIGSLTIDVFKERMKIHEVIR